jgi:hypothetical protein
MTYTAEQALPLFIEAHLKEVKIQQFEFKQK